MDNVLRKRAAEELAQILGCSIQIAGNILGGMDKEAKEQNAKSA